MVEFLWEVLKLLAKLWKQRRRCLLIIEDNDIHAKLLAIHAERLGYKCDVVDTAEAGLALARKTHPRVIFCDIRLPMKSGLSFLDDIRETSPNSEVVLVPGLSGDLAQLPASRRVVVIVKPVSREAVEDCIRHA